MNNLTIREIEINEYYILKDMLYEAIYQPDESKLLPKNVIENPDIRVYIDNFGKKKHDFCLVAELEGKITGAVWIRVLADGVKGYGNIDSETPEFAISLFKEYRKRGIGALLMQEMIIYMRNKGYAQASLSVDKNNYAVKMYKRLGFEIIEEREHDYLMLLKLLNKK